MDLRRLFRLPITACAASVAFALAGPADAATIFVPSGAAPTIQIALNIAADGDEIVVLPGTYFETLDVLGKAVTLRSEQGPEVTIVDALGQFDSVIHCTSGEGPDTVIEGLTLRNGEADDRGGGIYVNNSSPTIVDCIFADNEATLAGGGLYSNAGNPTLTGCRFVANRATFGGAIYLNEGTSTVENCVFERNEALNEGGAMQVVGPQLTITDSTFLENTSVTYGGALSIKRSSSVEIDRCLFDGNFSGDGGSNGRGGAIYGTDTSVTTVRNSVFVGNGSRRFGGAIFGDVSMTILNSSFSGNTGSQSVYGGNRVSTFRNCVVWGNANTPLNANVSVSYCDVEGGWAGTGNISADPLFVDAVNDDLRLQPGSPCIDAGDTTLITGGYPVDYDGLRRAVDDPEMPDTGVAFLNLTVDMGAHELQADGFNPCPSDLDDSGFIDFGDILRILTDWGPCGK